MMQNKPYIVAITGGIASGKSTATKHLVDLGYPVIDFDKISREVMSNRFVIRELAIAFGDYIIEDNKVNRKRLGKIVFSDRFAREKLNRIMHPRIYIKASREIKKLADERLIFLDIPLLFESRNEYPKFYSQIDEIWVVTTNERVQKTRLMLRDKIDLSEAEGKIGSQLTLQFKEKLADVVIYNNGNLNDLYETINDKVASLEEKLK